LVIIGKEYQFVVWGNGAFHKYGWVIWEFLLGNKVANSFGEACGDFGLSEENGSNKFEMFSREVELPSVDFLVDVDLEIEPLFEHLGPKLVLVAPFGEIG